MTAHPGAFCSPIGSTDITAAGTPMVCSVGPKGGRARMRRNGPTPARTPRPRKSRATGGSLPRVDTGINPHQPTAQAPAPADLNGRIRDAYTQLTDQPGQLVPLTELRKKLPDIPRDQLDQALTKMLDNPAARLEPEQLRHRVGPDERAAAVHVGGEDRHLFSLS